jgi:hypothetical protein
MNNRITSSPITTTNPDPSVVTSEAIDRRVNNVAEVISARIDGMEKAVAVFQADLTRVPTQLDRAIKSLDELQTARISRFESELQASAQLNDAKLDAVSEVLKQRLDGMDKAIELFQKFTDRQPDFVRDQVMHLRELHDEGFKGIQEQFRLLKAATEQLDLANKTAIAAALQAQKESAGETQKSSQAAIAKSETSTSEAIKALTATFTAAIAGASARIDDIKGRLDRGEGRTSISDPETTIALRSLSEKIASLADTRSQHVGSEKQSSDSTARMLGIAAVVVAIAIGVGEIIVRAGH